MNAKKSTEESLKAQGNQAFHKKEYQKAIKFYSQGIKSFPTNPIFYLNRALAYISIHFYQESLADLSQARFLDPKNPKIYYRTALVLELSGEYEKAIETLHEFISFGIESAEICELLSELNEKKDKVVRPHLSERKKFEELLRWTSAAGGEFPKIYLEYYSEDYRGVHCQKAILPEETIIFIPYQHLLTLQVTKQTPLAKKLIKSGFDLNYGSDCFFAAFILLEQSNPDSFWSPYINMLPQSFKNFPIFFTESEKKYFIGSPFLDLINERFEGIQDDYKAICAIDESFVKYSLIDFCKARMSANSRIFAITVGNQETEALAPLADMVNHQVVRNASWTYSNERGGFVVKAEKPIAKGEQIFDTYGTKSNTRYLLSYGFIQDSNVFDDYPYVVRLTTTLPHYRTKCAYLRENYHIVRLGAKLDHRFLVFLSCLRFYEEPNEEKVNEFISNCMSNNSRIDPATYKLSSMETEKLAIRKFIYLTEDFLSKYPTSLDADKEKLKGKLSENEINSLKLIISEKEILTFFKKVLPELYNVIDSVPNLNTPGLSPSIKFYTEKVLIPLHS